MDNKKLKQVEQELRHLRIHCKDLRPDVLVSIAKRLGRDKKAGFTNEPTYVRLKDPALAPPLSIPAHSTLKTGTARSIISALLVDVDDWKQHLMELEDNVPDDSDTDLE